MKISTQATKFINEHYHSAGNPAPDGVDALAVTIGAQLAAVEEVVDFGKRFENVIIVKIVSREDHPDSDHLHVCKVDDGGKAENVERDEQGLVQIVCGAPNVRAGMLAAWLPPGSVVPSTADAEPFTLEARAIRGVVSNGMMASAKELSLSDNHDGILDIDEGLGPIAPGTYFVDAFHLRDDSIIDMENKMFTHRPDCFGWLGIARELEGIQHRAYKSPDWYKQSPEFPGVEGDELNFEVVNEIPELVPRFTAIAMRDVQIKPSPVWLQVDLARAGLRSINNIVDYTNFYMLLTGQPIHAYDYDKVKAFCGGDKAVLTVRYPNEGETITLLNGKTITPRKEAMMVAAGAHLACVGGAMGGADTEVDETTQNIIIEAANWDMYSMRKTSMVHGLFTDAVTRFNKGQSPLQNLAALWKITDQVQKNAGGKIASPLIDINHASEEARARGNVHTPVVITTKFINDRLGWELSAEEMTTLLTNVEFAVETSNDELTVTAPFWRTDIEIPEDVVEEIGRLYGYDKLPLDLPTRDISPATKNPLLTAKSQMRSVLAAAGANELVTYSFVHGNLLDQVGQSRDEAFQLSNALSPDLQYLRVSLLPSLLDKVHPNVKAGHETFALFELGKAHNKIEKDDEELPREQHSLAFVFAASGKATADYAGAPYYQARKYLMHALSHHEHALEGLHFVPLAEADLFASPWLLLASAPFEPGRSAVLYDLYERAWGVVGEFKVSVRKALKLPDFTAGFEIDPTHLAANDKRVSYFAKSRFPSVEQDLCLKVPAEITYSQVFEFVASGQRTIAAPNTFLRVAPVDVYQRPDDPMHKQVTLRLTFASYERTLTDEEVSKLLEVIAQDAQATMGAERV